MSVPVVLKPFSQRIIPSSMMELPAFLLIASIVLLILSACSRQVSYPTPVRIGPDIVIDTSVLEVGVPKFYTYPFHEKHVNFFVVKIGDRILSFLDACTSCYPHKRGYRYEDNAVICRDCNVRLPIDKLEKGIGNCYPIKIEGRIEKGKYLIPADILEKAAVKF